MVGLCFLATLAYENAYQFVYSTNDSIDVQANKLLEKNLNQTFACANGEFAKITGTPTPNSRPDIPGRRAASVVTELTQVAGGLSGIGTGPLLQPLSIDQFMAYDEYFVPAEDAPVIQKALYDFTNEAIYGCLEQFEVRVCLLSLIFAIG